MIARTWRGWTKRSEADAYVAYLRETGQPHSLRTPGNRGFAIFRRDDGERTEIVTLSLWDSFEAIETFAGKGGEVVFYPEDDRFLIEREPFVTHFDVASGQISFDSDRDLPAVRR